MQSDMFKLLIHKIGAILEKLEEIKPSEKNINQIYNAKFPDVKKSD